MIFHLIKLSLRNIRRNLVFSAINIIGLSIGLALSFVILLYVSDSLSYDRFHENKNEIFRLTSISKIWDDVVAEGSFLLSERIREEITDTENVLTISTYANSLELQKDEEFLYERKMYYVDNNFFRIMSFELEYGDPKTALDDPFSIVITKKMAIKYFDKKNPIGKSILVRNGDQEYELWVTGILKDIPRLSTFRPEIMLSTKLRKIIIPEPNIRSKYMGSDCSIFLLLHNGQNKIETESKLTKLLHKYYPEDEGDIELQNIRDFYLGSSGMANNDLYTGDIKMIRIFSILGILILLISCVNYIIISIAQSATRNKEIAIKKIVGASRQNVIKQILNESVILCIVAFPTALVLVEIFLPTVNNLFDIELKLFYFDGPQFILLMLGITILVGLLSGLYVAIYLSKLKPVSILKQKFRLTGSKNYLGKALIIFQIIIFTSLIFSCLVIYKQVHFAKSIDQGFDKNNLMSINCIYNRGSDAKNPLSANYQQFIDAIRLNTDIVNASGCTNGPISNSSRISLYTNPENPDKSVIFESLSGKYNLIETLGFDLIEGRNFSEQFASDSIYSVIINEEGVKALGLTDPIGKTIKKDTSEYIIIGVIKDFFMHSVHELIPPMVLSIAPDNYIREVLLRYKPGKTEQVLVFLNNKFDEISTEGVRIRVQFYNEKIDKMYNSEKLFGRNIIIFSIIAIITASLGLFGFSLFMSRQKTKEIGIRKVLGASVLKINKTINSEFIILSLIANILIQPFVWIIMNKWLDNYAYRTSIGIDVIIFSFLISTLIVLLTINININLAARKNPVDTLRYE